MIIEGDEFVVVLDVVVSGEKSEKFFKCEVEKVVKKVVKDVVKVFKVVVVE